MKVPARIAASWGVGTFATTTMLNGVSVVLLYFLVTFVKVEPVIAGALLFGPSFSTYLRTRSKIRRLQPFGPCILVLSGFRWSAN